MASSYIALVIKDCRDLVSTFDFIDISFVRRSDNNTGDIMMSVRSGLVSFILLDVMTLKPICCC